MFWWLSDGRGIEKLGKNGEEIKKYELVVTE